MLTTYQILVQSAAIHPDWDAEDHAMYLWTEHFFREESKNSEFYALQDWCALWLHSPQFKNEVNTITIS